MPVCGCQQALTPSYFSKSHLHTKTLLIFKIIVSQYQLEGSNEPSDKKEAAVSSPTLGISATVNNQTSARIDTKLWHQPDANDARILNHYDNCYLESSLLLEP